MDRLSGLTATALLGIDTLWGGDVMNPSGTARAVVDSWFSDELLPLAYTHPTAGRARKAGGVGAKEPDRETIDAFLAAVDVKGAIDALAAEIHGLDSLAKRDAGADAHITNCLIAFAAPAVVEASNAAVWRACLTTFLSCKFWRR